MPNPFSCLLALTALSTTPLACRSAPVERTTPPVERTTPPVERDGVVETFATLQSAPGNVTVTPSGRVIVSLHQFYAPELRVAEIVGGELVPFPPPAAYEASGAPALDSVLGLCADDQGVVWLLDNAMRGGGTRKLVGWDAEAGVLEQVVDLGPPLTPPDAFLNDLAVDRTNDAVYIADPAGGANAALLVANLQSRRVRRVLEGHRSVIPSDSTLVIDGRAVRITGPDGKPVPARVGVNPIALDHDDEWLYFGPMHSDTLYRVETAALNDPSLSPEALAEQVEPYATRPITDGISIDGAGNIYLGDLASNAIGVIGADRSYERLASGPTLSWVDAFSFAPDGFVYAVANQLHRSAPLNAGRDESEQPYRLLRFRPLAPGRVGR